MRSVAVVAVLFGVAVAVVVLSAGGGDQRQVRALLNDASELQAGSQVRLAGQVVGHVVNVTVVDRDRAQVLMQIDGSAAWPLREGTSMSVGWLGTIAFAGEYVELTAPQHPGPPIDSGGLISSTTVTQPVGVEDVLGTLDATGRRDLRDTLRTSGQALDAAAQPLGTALSQTPAALEQARAVLGDLGDDPRTLDTLVRTASRVASAVNAANPGVGQLVDGAEGTFAAVALKSVALERTLDAAPPALTATRTTLGHADATLAQVDTLAERLSPGVSALRQATPDLQSVLTNLVAVAGPLQTALTVVHRASPSLETLLATAHGITPQLDSLATQATPQVGCVRPFAPEIAGLASTWGGFIAYGNKVDKIGRATVVALPFPNLTPLNSGGIHDLFPYLRYAFPRPPGEVAGQPWFQPQCDLGPDTLVPADDPEAQR